MALTPNQTRLAIQRAAALVKWLDDNGVVLQDEMDVLVPVPAMLLRDLRKLLG